MKLQNLTRSITKSRTLYAYQNRTNHIFFNNFNLSDLIDTAPSRFPSPLSTSRRYNYNHHLSSSIFIKSKIDSSSHPLSIFRHGRSIFIQTESTPNPDALKFIPGRPVIKDGGSREFLSGDDTRSSPLARSLLEVPGVKSVFFGPDFISINKDSDANWATIKPEIYSLLMELFSSDGVDSVILNHDLPGQPNTGSGPMDTRIDENDSEVVGMIKELLDTRVRPTIQEDGGDLEYKGFDEQSGVVRLMLKGSCRGCDSSSVTLKNGIERMLMHYIPEVSSVEQVESEEERVANEEFAKLEARLRATGKTVEV